jgi:hypothetical protein
MSVSRVEDIDGLVAATTEDIYLTVITPRHDCSSVLVVESDGAVFARVGVFDVHSKRKDSVIGSGLEERWALELVVNYVHLLLQAKVGGATNENVSGHIKITKW